MKVLVTGASGFVGQTLLAQLNQISGVETFIISRYEKHSSNRLLVGDLKDTSFIADVFSIGFDQVFHLAWEGIPDLGISYCSMNFQYGVSLLKELERYPSTQVNFLGSCLEYGSHVGKVCDSDTPGGRDIFALTKQCLNLAIRASRTQYRWFRPFYIYGRGQRRDALIPTILDLATANKILKLKNPNSYHDFIAVEDVCTAILKISLETKAFGEFNLGTGESTSSGEIGRAIYSLFDLEYSYEYEKVNGLVAQPNRARQLVGWKPKFAGLDGILEYVKSNLILEIEDKAGE